MAIKADIMMASNSGVGKIWPAEPTHRSAMMENSAWSVVGRDENDFLQFRRARAKIFFSFRARFRQLRNLYQDTRLRHLSGK